MTVSSHVLTLRKKHQELSEEIEEAQRGLATDDLHVTDCLLYTSDAADDA